jgi:hypothetical protein
MKLKPQRVGRFEPAASDKALAARPGTGEILQTVLTRFYRKGPIPGLSDAPELSRIAAAEHHRT